MKTTSRTILGGVKIFSPMLCLLILMAATTCGKSSGSYGGSGSTATTASTGGSSFSDNIIEVDAELDTCLAAAAESCGDDETCLSEIIATCWNDAWGDWTAVFCEDETLSAEYTEVCAGGDIDQCSDETLAAIEAADEAAGSNVACTQTCTCQFYEDADTDAFYSCLDSCEETEPDDGYDDDCVAYYDELLAAGTIDQTQYSEQLETVCAAEDYADWKLEMQDIDYLVNSSSVYSDSGWDWNKSNDSGGAANSCEVLDEYEPTDEDGDGEEEQRVIVGLALNAYDDNFNFVGKINVECLWLAWKEVVSGELVLMEQSYAMTGTDGNRVATEGCDGTFDTGGAESEVDFSKSNSAIVGLGFDGEDCGIEAAIITKVLRDAYDPETDTFLEEDTKTEYFMADGEDEAKTSEGEGWCNKAVATADWILVMVALLAVVVGAVGFLTLGIGAVITTTAYGAMITTYGLWVVIVASAGVLGLATSQLIDWGTDTQCDAYVSDPDILFDELVDKDAYIVGIGIAAAKDGRRCAVNIYTQTLEVTVTDGSIPVWEEGMTAEDAAETEDEDEDDDTEGDTEE